MTTDRTLPPPQGPEYARCFGCGHIEPEHRPGTGPCLLCACVAYRSVPAIPEPSAAGLGVSATPSHTDQAAAARVRALHQQYRFAGDDTQDYCAHCNQISGGWIPWPCPTVQAVGEDATAPRPSPAVLTETERKMLRYALDEAQEQMLCVGDEFSEDDHAAIDSLRRLADEAQQQEPDETEAHPPYHRWYTETRDGLAEEWAPGMRFTDRAEALARFETVSRNHPLWKDGTPVRRRFVRETTSYTVEQPDAAPRPEPSVHGESVAHLAGLHDDEPAVDAQTLADLFEGFGRLLATSSRDWGQYRVDAWLYAVILGWDCEETVHDETCTHGAMEEMQRQHGWSDEAVAKARRYRAAVRALTQPTVDARQDGAQR